MRAISTAPDHTRYSKPEIINMLKGLTYSHCLTADEVAQAQEAQKQAKPGLVWQSLVNVHRSRMA